MSEFNKYSTDGGATFIDVEDSNAVHWGDQSKGYVGKNLFNEVYEGNIIWGNNDNGFCINSSTNGCVVGGIIKKNTSYTVTRQGGNRFRLVLWGTKPTIPSAIETLPAIEVVQDNSLTEYTFNSGNYEYCALTCNNVDAYVLDDIKAMLRLSSISDSTYEEPYMSNLELTENVTNIDISSSIKALQGSLTQYDNYAYKNGKVLVFAIRLTNVTANAYTDLAKIENVKPIFANSFTMGKIVGGSYVGFVINTNGDDIVIRCIENLSNNEVIIYNVAILIK